MSSLILRVLFLETIHFCHRISQLILLRFNLQLLLLFSFLSIELNLFDFCLQISLIFGILLLSCLANTPQLHFQLMYAQFQLFILCPDLLEHSLRFAANALVEEAATLEPAIVQ